MWLGGGVGKRNMMEVYGEGEEKVKAEVFFRNESQEAKKYFSFPFLFLFVSERERRVRY